MGKRLKKHREIWRNKKILREIYKDWYCRILKDLFPGAGKTLELGSGSGNFKEFKPDVISSDIEPEEWLDLCFDAHKMPFSDNSLSNIVMLDVLHHLSNPIIFCEEAARVLRKKGRVIIVEPFPSFFSLVIYRKYHPEPFNLHIDYFSQKTIRHKDPWESNQAIAYLLFFKDKQIIMDQFSGKLKIVKKSLMSCLLYPASGGFEHKVLIGDWLIPVFRFIEILLAPFRMIFAFRCYVVLEKQ